VKIWDVLLSKSKLKLKSYLSEFLPANCKFICNFTPKFNWQSQTWGSSILLSAQKQKSMQ